ncbi:MAG: ADP-ribosylglycohydrolase family protein [Planctomycetota bacterium]
MRLTNRYLIITMIFTAAAAGELIRLPKKVFTDKCKGAWVGQMIGVCYGAPYEFRFCGKPITDPLKPWTPDRVAGAIQQDDLYVEMTYLKAIEKHGIDVTYQQAGKVFGQSKYRLAHANRYGRGNIHYGIMPPFSGHPQYNRHADDIDFQIESDLLGIICPGMPQQSNQLCDIFGHITNYGDGVYGGMFVAGMYSAAYLENKDVLKVIEQGLKCIPAESLYHQCISDVIRWHKQNPNDWLAAWKQIEKKWNDDIDCIRDNPTNIDAKLNGAYIVMGLLYGRGDFRKTLELATRCGQDADCNASNAAGVLGCMKGYKALGKDWTGGIADIEDTKFSYTEYSFKTLIHACQRIAEKLIIRAGGKINHDVYLLKRETPKPPPTLEQWINQKDILSQIVRQHEVNLWNPAWRVIQTGPHMEPGYVGNRFGRDKLFMVHPNSMEEPAIIAAYLQVPATNHPKLYIEVTSWPRGGDYILKVFVNDKFKLEKLVDTKGKFITLTVNLADHAGKKVNVRIENHANSWCAEGAYFDKIEIR